MFRRWLSEDSEDNTKVKRKKKLSPITGPAFVGTNTNPTTTTTTTISGTAALETATPGYQYALQEFRQTVPFGSIDDDGSSMFKTTFDQDLIYQQYQQNEAALAGYIPAPDHAETSTHPENSTNPNIHSITSTTPPSRQTSTLQTHFSEDSQDVGGGIYQPQSLYSPSGHYAYPYRTRQPFPFAMPNMPDSIYEEWYGDAYLGGPIKYLYPSGYQSMRPRGGPWRLSIVICLLFTWLSVFIIGHCSDRVDQTLYGDDDQIAIQTRWCGSKLLYCMWVVSMLITGLSASYCCVIGYIKVRDFAVANTRSQPPGLVGKSDYFVVANAKTNSSTDGDMYQSDGNPQFWGSHIYRPTQAAAAVTSR